MKKRLLAIALSMMMVITFIPAFSYADSGSDAKVNSQAVIPAMYNYVALGDAAAAGYGMTTDLVQDLLKGDTVKGSYPALLKSDIQKELARIAKPKTVNAKQYAFNGMRVEELRYMLDSSYSGDAYTQDIVLQELAARGYSQLMVGYFRTMVFMPAIKDADLITCGLGTVDFGANLLFIAQDPDKRATDPNVLALVDKDPDGVKAGLYAAATDQGKTVGNVCDILKVDGLDQLDYDKVIRGVAYAYYSFCYNFDKSIDTISEKNRKNAPIVVLKVTDVVGDLSVGVNILGINDRVNIGKLYREQLIDKANRHMEEKAKATPQIVAVVDTAEAETFMKEAGSYRQGNPGTISSQFKGYCDALEEALQLKDAAEGAGISSDAGLNGAYDTAATCLGQVAKIDDVTIDSTETLDYAKAHKDELKDLADGLMAGIRDKCLEDADKADKGQSYFTDLASFAGGGVMYGEEAAARPLGKLFMAASMRALMGNGFFQQPSAKGHRTIADSIMQAVRKTEQYCGEKGHTYGKVKVVTAAAFCRDGQGTKTCSNCGHVETVVIKGLGPKNTSISKLTGGKKKITVKWKKPSAANLKKTTGYEIRCSLKSSMASAKSVTVRKAATLKTDIGNLKAKKTYYVQIRTYKQSNGKKYYSDWSKAKKVKTK